MNSQALADELNALLATETRSLVRHLDNEATPYVTPATMKAWRHLQDLGGISTDHARRISRLIDELELPPRVLPFPTDVASFHYMTVERVLPLVIQEKKRQVAAYERALTHAGGQPRADIEIRALLAENREKLALLEADLSEALLRDAKPSA